jgi:AAA+ ATPase superfamily predicted ATPase
MSTFEILQLILSFCSVCAVLFVGMKQYSLNKNLANLTIEKDVRPLLLLEGHLENFSKFPQSNFNSNNEHSIDLESVRLKSIRNIATEVTGSIVISGNRYPLRFANEATMHPELKQNDNKEELSLNSKNYTFINKFSWLPEKAVLFCVADTSAKEVTHKNNQLKITYYSITGTGFRLHQDENFAITIKTLT